MPNLLWEYKRKRRMMKALDKPQKKLKDLSKATTNSSSRNNIFVGYEVGTGKYKKRFSSPSATDKYSQKLLKTNKGLSGSGMNSGVMMKPLYYGAWK